MKTVSTDLRAHLDKEVTTLCTCWIITRVDGESFQFTDADADVTIDGVTYQSIGAYKRTAVETTSTLSVDNLDIVGATNELALPEGDLQAGLFDNAVIKVFITSWMPGVSGQIKMRRGFFGEVQVLPNNTFQVELRGIMQRLAYNYTDIFSSTCLYDLGQPGCGVPIKPDPVDPGTTYELGDFVSAPQNNERYGKLYSLGLSDPDFELVGAAGDLDASVYWTNTGTADFILSTTEAYTGTYSVRGGSDSGELKQLIDILQTVGTPRESVNAGDCYLTLRAFQYDNGTDEGYIRARFLDDQGNVLGHGKQANFSGTDVNVSSFGLAGDFTIECWVYPTGTQNTNDGICGSGSKTNASTGNEINFDSRRVRLYNNPPGATGGSDVIVSPNRLTLNEWTHVAVVRDGDTLRIYENFDLVAEETGTGYLDTFTIDRIGGTIAGGFSGSIMELRIWEDVRTEYQLALYGNRSVSPGSTDLLRYYAFHDDSFDDFTGNDPASNAAGSATITEQTLGIAITNDVTSNANYSSGSGSVGTTWTEIGKKDHRIPAGTRYIEITLFATKNAGANAIVYFDNLTGYVLDTSQSGALRADMQNDVYWECTTAGSAGSSTMNGNVDAVVANGTASFTARTAWTRAGRVLSSTGARTFIVEVDEDRAVDAWFNGGTVYFESGDNAGAAMEVKGWDATTREIELFLSMPHNVKAGDLFSVFPGCDKSRISCAAIFDNVANFYGTPDIPGQDDMLRYPDSR